MTHNEQFVEQTMLLFSLFFGEWKKRQAPTKYGISSL